MLCPLFVRFDLPRYRRPPLGGDGSLAGVPGPLRDGTFAEQVGDLLLRAGRDRLVVLEVRERGLIPPAGSVVMDGLLVRCAHHDPFDAV